MAQITGLTKERSGGSAMLFQQISTGPCGLEVDRLTGMADLIRADFKFS